MSYAYTTTSHHFGDCKVNCVNRKWISSDEVEVHLERRESGGRRGDEITFHVSDVDAQEMCKGLLNIIGNDREFHKELEQLMRVQRIPE